MQRVFVLDSNKQPLMPCNLKRARELLKKGRAVIYRYYPFTIILKGQANSNMQPLEVKIDPGSKVTGMVLVLAGKRGRKVIWAANLEHRGNTIKQSLEKRRAIRRSRRSRKLGYRQARFNNRKRAPGWLAPSLKSRVDNITNWVKRLMRFSKVTEIAVETVRFDTQKMQTSDIEGIQYQQGTLFGYELKEYVLEKWQRTCAYCDAKNEPLEIDHIVPKSKGGSDRVSNLILACRPCNIKKGASPIDEFLSTQQSRLKSILRQVKVPLKDAAVVNSTRNAIFQRLKALDVPISIWSGGRTKFNRIQQAYPKDHWIDAACVGETGKTIYISPELRPLIITNTGKGSRQMCRVDRHGFPRTSPKSCKEVQGFRTGDLIKAHVTKGKNSGRYQGRVAIRASGNFNLKTLNEVLQGIHVRYCKLIQHGDGYNYKLGLAFPLPAEAGSIHAEVR